MKTLRAIVEWLRLLVVVTIALAATAALLSQIDLVRDPISHYSKDAA